MLRQGREWNNNLEWTWKIGWRKSLFDWEKHQEQELDTLLGRKTFNEEKEDKWVWKESDDSRFTVQYVYRVLNGEV